jgi:hypothetical protein
MRHVRVVLVLALVACSGDSKGNTTPTGKVGDASDAAVGGGGDATITAATHRRGGVPHHAQIDVLALSRDGKAAVSRDAIGDWRVWPSLDGAVPSQRVPIAGAIDAAIENGAAGIVIAAIDPANALHLVRVDAKGVVTGTATVPPEPPIERVAITPGGAHVVAVLSDQSVLVVDAAGNPVGRASLRGGRVERLVAIAGDKALGVIRRSGNPVRYEARWLAIGAKPAWGDAIPLTDPVSANGDAIAVSNDGRLLAYLAAPVPVAPPAAGSGSGAGPRLPIKPPPPPPPTTGLVDHVALVDLKKAKSIAVGEPANVAAMTTLGFTADRDLLVIDQTASTRIVVDADNASLTTYPSGLPAVSAGISAIAPGLAVATHQASLVLARADGSVVYLGHRDTAPVAGALSPSGKTAAWITAGGALIIEQLDGETERVILPDSRASFGMVELIDDDTVVVVANQTLLFMFDVDTGKRLGETPIGATIGLQYQPETKLLLVPVGNTAWLYLVDRAAPQPFGKRLVVPESTSILLDPDLAGGSAMLGSDGGTVRRYTLDEIKAGVSRAQAKEGRVTLPTPLFTFDRAGRPYSLAWQSAPTGQGRFVESWTRNNNDPWDRARDVQIKVADDTTNVVPSPDGSRFLVHDSRGTITVFARTGGVQWAAAMTSPPTRIAWAGDGTRVLAVSPGGGEIFDAAAGTSLLRACGWRFGADTSPPPGIPMGVASVCSAPITR